MKLTQAKTKGWYSIDELDAENADFAARLLSHGFVPGEKLMVKRFAPIFKDPILVEVAGTQLALTKKEANCIQVSELG